MECIAGVRCVRHDQEEAALSVLSREGDYPRIVCTVVTSVTTACLFVVRDDLAGWRSGVGCVILEIIGIQLQVSKADNTIIISLEYWVSLMWPCYDNVWISLIIRILIWSILYLGRLKDGASLLLRTHIEIYIAFEADLNLVKKWSIILSMSSTPWSLK